MSLKLGDGAERIEMMGDKNLKAAAGGKRQRAKIECRCTKVRNVGKAASPC